MKLYSVKFKTIEMAGVGWQDIEPSYTILTSPYTLLQGQAIELMDARNPLAWEMQISPVDGEGSTQEFRRFIRRDLGYSEEAWERGDWEYHSRKDDGK